ncbi:MAG: glycoside hydrolase family 5 protein [Rickettsiaceae bacterium]|nr:glycoside hydrolase family 5 protein [Rickettsiaceae bacterium]
MAKHHKNYISMLIVYFMLILTVIVATAYANENSINSSKITFWQLQKKGANIFNENIEASDIRAAKEYGIEFIRLCPDKFSTLHHDFLIGNADNYVGLIKKDLEKFKKILDMCHNEGMPVVITMLSLPGSRWKQNNQNKDDLRIWKNKKYQDQAAHFWQNLASELKNHPAIVGYNILNEPHPERIFASKEVHINKINREEAQKMLYDFYDRIIKNIRHIDKETPIILDSSAYADPKTFVLLIPQRHKNILYSFHMYEPYEYTNHKMNNGKFSYPGQINDKQWDKKALEEYMSSVIAFQKNHDIPKHKILIGEFGGHRMSPGLEKYFEDLITIFNQHGWHFAFYAFREDVWDGMDYELGTKKLPWSYWKALEDGKKPVLKRKDNYPAFLVIRKNLNGKHY